MGESLDVGERGQGAGRAAGPRATLPTGSDFRPQDCSWRAGRPQGLCGEWPRPSTPALRSIGPWGGAGRAPRLVGGGQALLPTGHVTPTRTRRERPPSKQMRNPEDLRRPQCHRVGTARRARASGDRSHSLPRGAPLTRVSVSLMCGFQLGLIPIKRP